MKKKFKNRKKLKEIANRIGLFDETVLTAQRSEVTNEPFFQLVNNQRRFVKGILSLPINRQNLRIKALEAAIERAEKEKADKLAAGVGNDSDRT